MEIFNEASSPEEAVSSPKSRPSSDVTASIKLCRCFVCHWDVFISSSGVRCCPLPACARRFPVLCYCPLTLILCLLHVWVSSLSTVTMLCRQGKMPGTFMLGHQWLIPNGTVKD